MQTIDFINTYNVKAHLTFLPDGSVLPASSYTTKPDCVIDIYAHQVDYGKILDTIRGNKKVSLFYFYVGKERVLIFSKQIG